MKPDYLLTRRVAPFTSISVFFFIARVFEQQLDLACSEQLALAWSHGLASPACNAVTEAKAARTEQRRNFFIGHHTYRLSGPFASNLLLESVS